MTMRWGMVLTVVLLCGCGAEMQAADAGPMADAPVTPDTAVMCSPGCASVQLCCPRAAGNRCVDYFSDPMNCGGCGVTCDVGELCINAECATP